MHLHLAGSALWERCAGDALALGRLPAYGKGGEGDKEGRGKRGEGRCSCTRLVLRWEALRWDAQALGGFQPRLCCLRWGAEPCFKPYGGIYTIAKILSHKSRLFRVKGYHSGRAIPSGSEDILRTIAQTP